MTADEQPSLERPYPLRDHWAPLALHALVVAPILLGHQVGVPPLALMVGGGMLVLMGYPLIVVMEFRISPLALNPLSYFFAWHWVMLGAAALWEAWSLTEGLHGIIFSGELVSTDDLAAGYAVYVLGVLLFHLGVSVLRPVAGAADRGATRDFSWSAFGLLWVIGVSARLFQPWLTWMGNVLGVAAYGSIAALCALALNRSVALRAPRRFWLLIFGGIIFEFVLGLVLNSKAEAMSALLPIAWLTLQSPHRSRNLVAVVAAATVLYVGVVFPVNAFLRREGLAGVNTRSVAGDDLIAASEAVRAIEWSTGTDAFFGRIFGPTPVGYIVSQVRTYGHRYGETMDYLAYAFIPRLFWPDKPTVTRGRWFDVYINQGLAVDEQGNSLGQTNSGELYWNFGVPGVIAGMFLMGLLIGWLWRMAGANPLNDPLRMLLYVGLVLSSAAMMETEFGSAFVGLVYRVVLFGLVFKLSTLRRRRVRLAT